MNDKVIYYDLDGSLDNYFKFFTKVNNLLCDDISFYVSPVIGYCEKCDKEYLIASIVLDIEEE